MGKLAVNNLLSRVSLAVYAKNTVERAPPLEALPLSLTAGGAARTLIADRHDAEADKKLANEMISSI